MSFVIVSVTYPNAERSKMNTVGASIAYKVMNVNADDVDECDELMIAQQAVGNIPIMKIGDSWLFETYNKVKIADGVIEDLGMVGGRHAWKMFRPFYKYVNDPKVLKQFVGKLVVLGSKGLTWGEHILPGDMLELCDSKSGVVHMAGKVEFTKQTTVGYLFEEDIIKSFSARMCALSGNIPESNKKLVKHIRREFPSYSDSDLVTTVGFRVLSTIE